MPDPPEGISTNQDVKINLGPHLGEENHESQTKIGTAILKVNSFVDQLFGGNIPPELKTRIDLLKDPEKIVTGDKFNEEVQMRMSDDSEVRQSMIAGFHDSKKDKIFLPNTVSEKTAIHEILHFLSFSTGRVGIKLKASEKTSEELLTGSFFAKVSPSRNDVLEEKPNEAITEILALLIASGINFKSPFSLESLDQYISDLETNGKLNNGVYSDYVKNVMNFFKKNLNTTGLLGNIAKKYLAGDRDGFNSVLQQHRGVVGKITRFNSTEKFYQAVGVEGQEKTNRLRLACDNVSTRFASDPRFSQEMRHYLDLFSKSLGLNSKFKTLFLHPEQNPLATTQIINYVDIQSAGKAESLIDPAQIKVDLRLLDHLAPIYNEAQEVLDRNFTYLCQFEAFMLWQGVQINHLNRNGLVYDHDKKSYVDSENNVTTLKPLDNLDLLNNPTMIDYLSRLNPSELTMVLRMFTNVFRTGSNFNNMNVLSEIFKLSQQKNTNFTNSFDVYSLDEVEGNLKLFAEKYPSTWEDVLVIDNKFYYLKLGVDPLERLHS